MASPVWALLALVLTLLWHPAAASGIASQVKSQQSNPVLQVVVEGQRVNLILTADIDGILFCQDRSESMSPSASRIDYDYARKLLRYQLSDINQAITTVQLQIPSLNIEPQLSVGVFYISQQSLSPSALAYFLHEANADGFIGVGYAFRPVSSSFWKLFQPANQYLLALAEPSVKSANTATLEKTVSLRVSKLVAGDDGEESIEWDWSEPCASVDQADDLTRANNQGLVFPIHHVQFQCALSTEKVGKTETEPKITHHVDVMGEFTSNWDATIDFNSPCLVLPQQFYNSLAGWTDLSYNEDLKLTEVSRTDGTQPGRLPSLQFSLMHDGPRHEIDLNMLLLNSTTSRPNDTQWLCLQRSSSIVHNGATVFSPIDTDTAAQRMRLHGTMLLPVFNMLHAPIVFGTMVLRAMGDLVVDGDAKQVAFAYKQPPIQRQASQLPACVPSPRCVGQQQFSARINACQDPDCSSYYFQSLDPDSKLCVIDSDWLTFLTTAIAVFVAAELLLSASISRTVRAAVTATPPASGASASADSL